jgi:hypothetical protein
LIVIASTHADLGQVSARRVTTLPMTTIYDWRQNEGHNFLLQ